MQHLILGLGNLLLADEGVGVHVAQSLLDLGQPEGTMVLDVGNAVIDALPAISVADKVIVVDAMQGGGPPGTVYKITLDDCVDPGPIGSVHGFDLKSVLHLINREIAPEVVVIGVEPERVSWSTELSAAVTDAIPDVITAVTGEIES
jgi:hydrogenase maturation protease